MVNVLECTLGSEQFYSIVYWRWKWSTLFTYLLPCQRIQSALSNVENGNRYSALFTIGKNVPDAVFSLGRGQATSEKLQENKFKTTKPIGLTPREDAENANWLSSLHACFGHRFQAVGLKAVVLQLFSSVCVLLLPSSLPACVSCTSPQLETCAPEECVERSKKELRNCIHGNVSNVKRMIVFANGEVRFFRSLLKT